VDKHELTREVEVKPDPRVKVTPEELAAQEKFILEVRDEIGRLSDLVNRLQSLRQQVRDRDALLADDAKAAALVKAGGELVIKLNLLEEKLHNPRAKAVYDILAQRGGAKLYSQLAYLLEQVKDADGPVPQGVRAVFEEQSREFRALEKEWEALLKEDAAKLNATAKTLDVPGVIVPKAAR
jgi:hypothetical protein